MKKNIYNEAIEIIKMYTNPYDMFVSLFDLVCRNEGLFSKVFNHIDNKLWCFEDEKKDQTFQNDVWNCVDEVINNKFGVQKKLLEYLEKYSDYIFDAIIRFITHFDNKISSYVKLKIYDRKSLRSTIKLEPLNDKSRNIGLLYISSHSLQVYDYRVGRKVMKRGCCSELVMLNFGLVKNVKDYSLEVSACTDIDINLLETVVKKDLKIATSHFTSDKILKSEINGNMFRITGVKNEAMILNKLKYILKHMDENGVDIVIFPEMLFTNSILYEIQKFMALSLRQIKLLVLGSIWENRVNRSLILSGKGKLIHEQVKMNNFHKNIDFRMDGCNEDILLNNRKIKLLDVIGFGRISNLICVDLIVDDVFDFIKNIGVSYFLSPVYTSSIEAMMEYSISRMKHYGCLTYASNCCTPVNDSNKSIKSYTSFFTKGKDNLSKEFIHKIKNCSKGLSMSCKYTYCYDLILINNKRVDYCEAIRVI